MQRWFQSILLTGIAGADGPGAIVVGSNRLTAPQRLFIYARGYRLRLLETLRAEFPLLLALAGEQVFDLFATAYLQARPSTSYTLYELGAGFADWLEANRPPGPVDDPAGIPAALARLDRARALAHRGRGVERDPPAGTTGVALLDLLAPGRLYRPDTVHLLDLPFDLLPLVEAHARGEALAPPAPGHCRLAVCRARYRVQVLALTAEQQAFLEGLGPEGALAPPGLRGWVPEALSAGLLTAHQPATAARAGVPSALSR